MFMGNLNKTFRIFKCKIRNIFSNPTKEVTDIRAIQLNSSFTQVTFFVSR